MKKNFSLAEIYGCCGLKHINVTIMRNVLLTEPHGNGCGKDMRYYRAFHECSYVCVITTISKWLTNGHYERTRYLCLHVVIGFQKNIMHNFAVSKFLRNFANVYHFNAVDALLHLRFRRATRLHALQRVLRCCCTHVMHYTGM